VQIASFSHHMIFYYIRTPSEPSPQTDEAPRIFVLPDVIGITLLVSSFVIRLRPDAGGIIYPFLITIATISCPNLYLTHKPHFPILFGWNRRFYPYISMIHIDSYAPGQP